MLYSSLTPLLHKHTLQKQCFFVEDGMGFLFWDTPDNVSGYSWICIQELFPSAWGTIWAASDQTLVSHVKETNKCPCAVLLFWLPETMLLKKLQQEGKNVFAGVGGTLRGYPSLWVQRSLSAVLGI